MDFRFDEMATAILYLRLLIGRLHLADWTFQSSLFSFLASFLTSSLGSTQCAPTCAVCFNAGNTFHNTKSARGLGGMTIFDNIGSSLAIGFVGAFFHIEYLLIP